MIQESHDAVHERHQSLWLLTTSPTIWAAHFLLSYIGGAVWCGLAGQRSAGLGMLHALVIGTALIALIGIGLTGRAGWRKHTHKGQQPLPHDEDTPEDRHRFLGFATVLLSCLSAIATIYVAISVLFVGNCY